VEFGGQDTYFTVEFGGQDTYFTDIRFRFLPMDAIDSGEKIAVAGTISKEAASLAIPGSVY